MAASMNVHEMALAAGDNAPRGKYERTDDRITVTLQWVEIPEPNFCEVTFRRNASSTRRNLVGEEALTTLKSRLPMARFATKSIGGASAKDSKLVLVEPLSSSPKDRSIYSLESLYHSKDGCQQLRKGVQDVAHKVRLDVRGDEHDREVRGIVASGKHDERCAAWIKKAEDDIRENVLKNPSEYEFDAKLCLFQHKKSKTVKFLTFTQIETPLVKKDRYNVCIDGYLLLQARKACGGD